MRTFRKWALLVALLYLPMVYFVAVFVFATKVPDSASVVALAPYAVGLLLIAYLVKGQGRWRSGRGLVALPIAGIGYAGLAAIFAALVMLVG